MQLNIIEHQSKAQQTALDALSPSPISCILVTLAIAFSYSHSSVRHFDSLAINDDDDEDEDDDDGDGDGDGDGDVISFCRIVRIIDASAVQSSLGRELYNLLNNKR